MRKTPSLGKVQLQIMQFLWDRGQATAREITDELSKSEPIAPIAHSTVQTLLRKLEAKGAVAHSIEERVFVFRPLSKEAEVTTSATRDLLSRVFQGSTFGLVSHLLKHEKLSREELEQLRAMIDEEVQS